MTASQHEVEVRSARPFPQQCRYEVILETAASGADGLASTVAAVLREHMTLFQGINVVSISVTDLERAREFYRDTLGLGEPIYDLPDAGWIEFSTGAASGNVSVTLAEPGWQPSTGTTLVLNTRDCRASHAEMVARGVRCDEPVTFEGFVTYCSFYDPFGNRLQMCSDAS